METVYFVSGHVDLTPEEFEEHYVPVLQELVLYDEIRFVVGDSPGADTMAQDWLYEHRAMVTVYHMKDEPRYLRGTATRSGFKSDDSRDKAMTLNSTHDIAWIRPGRESSGTGKNLERRHRLLTYGPDKI